MLTEPEQIRLSQTEDVRIRIDLAKNTLLAERVQNILAKDEDLNVRGYLAINSSLVERLQDVLAKDENWNVRAGLTENPALVERLQDILVKDENVWVRAHLAENKNLKLKPAIRLFYDNDNVVVEALHSENNELCMQIKTMEDTVLTANNMQFLTLMPSQNKAKVIKPLMLKQTF